MTATCLFAFNTLLNANKENKLSRNRNLFEEDMWSGKKKK